MLDIGKDIHSLSDFKRNTPAFLKRIRKSGNPLVLTINGKAEMVVQDAKSYQRLLDEIDGLQTLEGIKRGRADVAAGRVTSLDDFERTLRARKAVPRRSR